MVLGTSIFGIGLGAQIAGFIYIPQHPQALGFYTEAKFFFWPDVSFSWAVGTEFSMQMHTACLCKNSSDRYQESGSLFAITTFATEKLGLPSTSMRVGMLWFRWTFFSSIYGIVHPLAV
jgi:hypothetical protein